ncbi:hypothetical protein HDU96_010813 [Phlyctochytrium bullatum]|nr:hypothetical protein HDU96_010813 [Phlyctochytrium bullatum]
MSAAVSKRILASTLTTTLWHLAVVALLVCIWAPLSVEAHFKVSSPPARFKSEALQVIPPCGGVPLGQRTPFPLAGANLKGDSFHASAQMTFSLALVEDPKESDFSAGSFSTVTTAALAKPGPFEVVVDLTKVQEAKVGANATLRIVYNAGDGILYQCSDVTLTAAETPSTTATPKSAAQVTASMSWLLAFFGLIISFL